MAPDTVSKASLVVKEALRDLADELICKALISAAYRVAAFHMRHPGLAEFVAGCRFAYAWSGAVWCPPWQRKAEPRDPSWEAVQARTAVRASQIRAVN